VVAEDIAVFPELWDELGSARHPVTSSFEWSMENAMKKTPGTFAVFAGCVERIVEPADVFGHISREKNMVRIRAVS
jgi:hypothetical protein